MKKQFLISFLALGAFAANAQNRSMNFETNSWNDILAKAEKENKLIFLDAYTSWCGPCKWMAANTFTNDTVADFYNRNFINAKIDMEKGEGPEIAKKYQVNAYPNLLYINGKGEVVHRACGGQANKPFITTGLAALNPYENFASIKSDYDNGNRRPEFMKSYLGTLDNNCMNTAEAATAYFKTQSEADLKSEANWKIMQEFLEDMDSREFNYLLKNKEEFSKLYSEEKVNRKFSDVYLKSGRKLIYSKTPEDKAFTDYKTKIKASGFKGADEVVFELDLMNYYAKKDWANYAKTAAANDKYFSADAGKLNQFAWTFYENVNDKKMLAKAEEWAKRSVEIEPGSANMDTYAAVLFKQGKKAEAIKAEERAIEEAKKEGSPTEDYEAFLKKIKDSK